MAGGIVVLSWLTVLAQESRHPDSAIRTPLHAFWWAIVTMFTVGYGDTYPHTVVGKVAATLLMFSGHRTVRLGHRLVGVPVRGDQHRERGRNSGIG